MGETLRAGYCGRMCLHGIAHAQDNYEIQVYGSETIAPANTMVELHSKYTIQVCKRRDAIVEGFNAANANRISARSLAVSSGPKMRSTAAGHGASQEDMRN